VGRIHTLLAAAPSLPLTLCHGDCHRDNLLRGPKDEFVWADWQEVELEQRPRDLAFLFQRAHFAGATVPCTDTLRAYQERLEADTGAAIPLAAICRASDTAELRGWLLDCPPYLAHGSPQQLERVVARIQESREGLGGARET
jgi:Ser/Thr protein kinase RdoA (MazF antagonist)